MKIKPAGKAVIALTVIGAAVGCYFAFLRPSVQDNAQVAAQEAAQGGASGGNEARANVATGNAGVLKEVKAVKTNAAGEVVRNSAGKPIVEVRREKVYTVALSEWPGHMAGIIACGGLTTQPGSACSTVRSSDPNGKPGIVVPAALGGGGHAARPPHGCGRRPVLRLWGRRR
jgi:hypothetical protein